MDDLAERVEASIATIPDFPEEGVLYRDITPLLHDHALFRDVTDHFRDRCADRDIDRIAAIESRGFLFGAPLAHAMDVSLALVRKPGKLPRETFEFSYELEYGSDTLELHRDALEEGDRILVVDDLLATGGTARAATQLVEKGGGEVVECAFLIELSDLEGREHIGDYDVYSLVEF